MVMATILIVLIVSQVYSNDACLRINAAKNTRKIGIPILGALTTAAASGAVAINGIDVLDSSVFDPRDVELLSITTGIATIVLGIITTVIGATVNDAHISDLEEETGCVTLAYTCQNGTPVDQSRYFPAGVSTERCIRCNDGYRLISQQCIFTPDSNQTDNTSVPEL